MTVTVNSRLLSLDQRKARYYLFSPQIGQFISILLEYPFSSIERTYVWASNSIRRKPDWQSKFKDPKIWKKWQDEIASALSEEDHYQYGDRPILGELTKAAWSRMKDELAWLVDQKSDLIEPAAVDNVWQADGLIPAELLCDLQTGVSFLENVPHEQKDWHPGSSGQVLDLVHPSLFPLVYGKTRKLSGRQAVSPSLKFMGGGEVIHVQFKKEPERPAKPEWGIPASLTEDYALSQKFQWLPSEFQVDEEGNVKILSYINNLHPIEHRGLYWTLEKVFAKMLPLFEKTLTSLRYPAPSGFGIPSMGNNTKFPDAHGGGFGDDDETEDSIAAKMRALPQVKVRNWKEPEVEAPVSLRNTTLQVIVKLANIILTPEKPDYLGGVWHVEGMDNERIVASGIYYYESENISTSDLAFRRSVRSPSYRDTDWSGNEKGYIKYMYGISNNNQLNEALGDIETRAGRCIAFPNILQHKVQPFSLVDKRKPGVRKILVFFLVDPYRPIISTINVPPQQREWYAEALARHIPEFSRLPSEILERIVSHVEDCPMSLNNAIALREELMHERKYVVDATNKMVFQRRFSLCEH